MHQQAPLVELNCHLLLQLDLGSDCNGQLLAILQHGLAGLGDLHGLNGMLFRDLLGLPEVTYNFRYGQNDDHTACNDRPPQLQDDPCHEASLAEDTGRSMHGQGPDHQKDQGEGQGGTDGKFHLLAQFLVRLFVILGGLDIVHQRNALVQHLPLEGRVWKDEGAHPRDEEAPQNGAQVADHPRPVLAERVVADLSRVQLRLNAPAREAQGQATDSSGTDEEAVGSLHEDGQTGRPHGAANDHAHGHVDPSQAEAQGLQEDRQEAHENCENGRKELGDAKQDGTLMAVGRHNTI
mmetsp:Transcript_83594/g.150816  ORF Transcript_83594/g.150816 Transcript_83594/m.150816 type:complete len:293 (-) Transcript_83594:1348-2226(-)